MGAPIPPPVPPPPVGPGDDCSVCWGPGKPFGLTTPEEVTITVTGVEKGPNWVIADGDPPEGAFICTQPFPAFPCFFNSDLPHPQIGVFFDAGSTGVSGDVGSGADFFSGNSALPCITVIENQLNDHFKNGTATITIPEVT